MSGDRVPCPICRKEFTVPDNGVDGLPKNFFIEQLKDVTHTSSRHCEGCCDDGTDLISIKQAVMFCVDCHQRYCESCVQTHRRMRVSQGHNLIETRDSEKIREAARGLKTIFCDKHPGKVVEVYCTVCKEAICMMCFIKSHKTHECSDVNEVVDEFREQMTSDIKNMTEITNKCLDVVKEQKKKKDDFSIVVDGIEKIVSDRAEQLKELIDSEKSKLIQELTSLKADRLKQIQHVIVEVEQRISFVGSLIKYTEELRDQGTSSDVAQQTRALHDRAEELMKIDDVYRDVNDLGSMEVSFEANESLIGETTCFIGKVERQHEKGNLCFVLLR